MTKMLCDNCGCVIEEIEDGIDEEQYSGDWCDDCQYEDDYDDSMDGDHDSAMTSCGWGTDEDYGYYGEDF